MVSDLWDHSTLTLTLLTSRVRPAARAAPFLLWFYLLIALVLFINLLIAMFNDTYVAITEKSEAQWKMSTQRTSCLRVATWSNVIMP